MSLDHYACLGLSPTASPADIEASWKRFAAAVHPDGKPEHEKERATKLFAEFSVRYSVLRDPAKRAAYDADLRAAHDAAAATGRNPATVNVTAAPAASFPLSSLRNDAVANFEFFLRHFDEKPFLSVLGIIGSGAIAVIATMAEVQQKQQLEELGRERAKREAETTRTQRHRSRRSQTRSAKPSPKV